MATDNKQALFPLSIRGYAIGFLILVATFFIGMGWYALHSIETVRANIQVNNQRAAHDELRLAIQQLLTNLNNLSEEISSWDEVFQQLENPSYYAYWHEHRLFSANILPDYIKGVEVYNKHGKALAWLDNTSFPQRIDIDNLTPTIHFSKQDAQLVMLLSIKRQMDQPSIEGYMAIRLAFLKTLKSQFRFRYLDADSLQLHQQAKGTIPLDQSLDQIEYRLRPNHEAETMMGRLKTSILQLATIIGILCFMFYFLLVYLLGKPLVEITAYIDKLRRSNPGSYIGSINTWFPVAELEKVRLSLNQYHAELEKAHGDLDEKNKELWEQAHHDSLTGMLNRRAFDNEWHDSIHVLSNRRIEIGLILFDVNHFKAINDTYGHQVGDQVLIAISQSIQNTLRANENLYRIGGDEFAAIIIGSSANSLVTLGERCIGAISRYDFSSLGIKETVRISCGISHCQASDITRFENLHWQADVAVYQAKRPGVNVPVLFDDSMTDGSEAVFSSVINNAIYDAVVQGSGIEMYYQPVVNTNNHDIAYYEALIRIQHNGEIIPPSNIFPVVHMRHLELDLDKAVIQRVISELSHGTFPGKGLSINLSAETVSHKDMVEWLSPLAEFVKHYNIILEVTETSLITQLSMA
jgi:diguanylate cyclase (GGDEF)-like protein